MAVATRAADPVTCAAIAALVLNAAKLAMLLFFLLATGPLASHALAKAALRRGLDPLLGRDLVDRHEVDDNA